MPRRSAARTLEHRRASSSRAKSIFHVTGSALGLRLDRIDLSVSSLQCLPSANANRSTSLSQFGFVHAHVRGIRRATTCGRDATELPRIRRACPRAATAAPRSGGRANVTVGYRVSLNPGAFKTRLGHTRISLNFSPINDSPRVSLYMTKSKILYWNGPIGFHRPSVFSGS